MYRNIKIIIPKGKGIVEPTLNPHCVKRVLTGCLLTVGRVRWRADGGGRRKILVLPFRRTGKTGRLTASAVGKMPAVNAGPLHLGWCLPITLHVAATGFGRQCRTRAGGRLASVTFAFHPVRRDASCAGGGGEAAGQSFHHVRTEGVLAEDIVADAGLDEAEVQTEECGSRPEHAKTQRSVACNSVWGRGRNPAHTRPDADAGFPAPGAAGGGRPQRRQRDALLQMRMILPKRPAGLRQWAEGFFLPAVWIWRGKTVVRLPASGPFLPTTNILFCVEYCPQVPGIATGYTDNRELRWAMYCLLGRNDLFLSKINLSCWER